MAYVVGSASVEIVPDFRNAQRKITAFFEGQGDRVKVPVDFEVDRNSAQRLRDEVVKSQRASTNGTRKETIEREQLYSRMFEQIEKREQQAARESARIRQQSIADEEREQRAYLERAGRVREQIERQYTERSTELTRRQLFDREEHYNKLFDQIDKRQRESDAVAARLAAVQAERDRIQSERNAQVSFLGGGSSGRSNYQNEFDAIERAAAQSARNAANERLRIEESTLSETERMRVRSLREQEQAEREAIERTARERAKSVREYTRLREEANRQTIADGQLFDRQEINRQADEAGREGGSNFGRALLNNFRQEVRTRATFIGAVLAAAAIAGAPALLAVGPVLFGGIGLAATANAEEVQSAWKSTWASILSDTRDGAKDFISVHTQLAARTREAFISVRPAIDAAFEAAAPQTERFGNALLEATQILLTGFSSALQRSSPVMNGFGELIIKTASGLSEMLDILANGAPAAGSSVSALGDVFGEILPMLGEVLAIGAEFSSVTLPLLTIALDGVGSALSFIAPILPIVAAGFTAMKLGAGVAAGVALLSTRVYALGSGLAMAAYNTTGLTRTMAGGAVGATTRLSSGMASASSAIRNAGAALPLFGAALAVVILQMQAATAEEEKWSQGFLDGAKTTNSAAAEYAASLDDTGRAVANFFTLGSAEQLGLAPSLTDAREAADDLLASMTPLQRAQTLATQATNDLSYATERYGRGSREWRGASEANATAQANLAEAQRQANIEMRDTVSSTDAAKAALEDYQAAVASGNTDAQVESLSRYKQETAEAAEETRLFNIATADTIASSEAAKLALDDYNTAIASGDTDGATEALSRYKRESNEAAYEQSDLEDAIYGTNQAYEDQRELVLSATDSGYALRQANLDMAEAQSDLAGVLADASATTADIEQANLDYEKSILDVATAAGQLAADQLPATASALERTAAQTDGTLQQLYLLRDQMGDAFPASLQETIRNLEGTRGQMDIARTGGDLLARAIGLIPLAHNTNITADTSSAEARIQSFLSRKWTADIVVTADMRAQGGYYADRAYGGILPGSSPNDRADNILYNGTAGEFVTQRPSVRKYGTAFMYAVNSGAFPIDLAMRGVSGVSEGKFERTANERQSFANGGLVLPDSVIYYNANMGDVEARTQEFVNKEYAKANAAGSGALGSDYKSIANIVQRAIPQARINSTFRPGDPGYHGRGKAVDFGYGSGPGGAGSQGLARIASFLYSGYGKTLAELIYDGLYDNSPDVKNGRDHTYNSGTRAEHRNHVHAAVYDWGGALTPGLNLLMNNTGETEYLSNSTAAINGFREMLGSQGGIMPRFDFSGLAGQGVGGNDMRSVTGFVNHGTVVVADMDEFAQKAEDSKRASMASLGLI